MAKAPPPPVTRGRKQPETGDLRPRPTRSYVDEDGTRFEVEQVPRVYEKDQGAWETAFYSRGWAHASIVWSAVLALVLAQLLSGR